MILWKINGILYSCNSKALMWSSPPSRWSRHSSPPLPHCSFGRRSLRNPPYVLLLGGSEWSNCKIVSALQSISKQMACILLTQRHYPRTKFLATKIQASQHCSYLAYIFSLSLSLFLTNQLTSHVETESSHFVHASFRAFRAFRILFAFCSCIVSCVSCVYGTWREKPCARAHRPRALCSRGIKTCAQKQISKLR